MNDFDGRPRKNFSEFPLVWLAASFACGILAAGLLEQPIFIWLIAALAGALSSRLFLQKPAQATAFVLLAFLFGGAFSQRIETVDLANDRISRLYDAGKITPKLTVRLVGVLQNELEEAIDGRFLVLKIERVEFGQTAETASGAVRLFLPLKDEAGRRSLAQLDLHYNARIRVAAELTREDRFRNPGYAPFRGYLKSKNLDAVGTIKDIESIEKLSDGNGFAAFRWLYGWRAGLIAKFKQRFSLPTAGVLAASLLNNRFFLDRASAERFREGGTFHILVISGAHITFIGLLFAGLVGVFTRNLWLQFLIANVLLWAFAVAVGAETPVVRAALMFTIVHAGALGGRGGSALNALGAATLILLVFKPENLFDPSFQLTFLSVFAIVGTAFPVLAKMREIGAWQLSADTPAPPVCSKRFKILCETLFWNESAWQRRQKRQIWRASLFKSNFAIRLGKSFAQNVWRFVFASILVSVIVSVWLAPLGALYFHRFSFAAIFLNVYVGALIAVETFLGILAVLIHELNPILAQPFVVWTEFLNFLLTNSAEPFIQTKLASIRLPIYTGALNAIYWIYYVPLICFAILAYRWKPFQLTVNSQQLSAKTHFRFPLTACCSLLTVLLLALVLFHPFSAVSTQGLLRVDFLDVGQGDAVLITTPNNRKILVDGGGRPNFKTKITDEKGDTKSFESDSRSIGDVVVSEFLWEKGFDTVDFLVSTHADADHIDGLNDVARNFNVGTAFVARAPARDQEFQRFAQTLRSQNVALRQIARGETLEIDNIRIEILSPIRDANENAVSDNDNSIVLRVVYGSRAFLLTGDIEAPVERFLVAEPENLTSDVVKVAHHGSRTSSTENFVRATNAKFAVISVGRDSPYNHPHREPLERWQNSGAKILTTGENGTISFTTDGTNLNLATFVEN